MILGLTGSIGSGKSTVAKMLQDWGGAKVIDADAVVRQVQSPGGGAYEQIILAFGHHILNPDGSIDRKRLGAEVFQDPLKREKLNSIVHPEVRKMELQLLQEYRNEQLVVFMVPLLFENGLEKYCDKTVTVTLPDTERQRRLFERSGLTPQEVNARLAAQMPESEKVRRCDFHIENGGTLAETERQVKSLLGTLGFQVL